MCQTEKDVNWQVYVSEIPNNLGKGIQN